MPGCRVHLSEFDTTEKTNREQKGETIPYIMERPAGVYFGLEVGRTYFCHVVQDQQQLKKDQLATQARFAAAGGGGGKKGQGDQGKFEAFLKLEDGRGFESCSCIYGNPCVDEYGCRDWTNRFAIARKNGWKGF